LATARNLEEIGLALNLRGTYSAEILSYSMKLLSSTLVSDPTV
jgi:hypothetical protein